MSLELVQEHENESRKAVRVEEKDLKGSFFSLHVQTRNYDFGRNTHDAAPTHAEPVDTDKDGGDQPPSRTGLPAKTKSRSKGASMADNDSANVLKGPYLVCKNSEGIEDFVYKLTTGLVPHNLFSFHVYNGRELEEADFKRLCKLLRYAPELLELLERIVNAPSPGQYTDEAEALIGKIKE